ncbi:hypothetical protein E0493_22365 [Roseomonas sp. M0104]|uniref:Transmembrane protein n=1 Tax=Teichococcus coralli TaxID=2545983 RepID=A0A845BLS8_9PROT|nr:hypothetical protein [Pseudoroseomonas coralli]MXP66092.1 hypothetical protein [Pseudoroseomonas coralli]
MNAKLDDEIADCTAEERSENEGMPEHPSKARDPARWPADRRAGVMQPRSKPPSGRTGMFGIALMSCAGLAALVSAHGTVRWVQRKRSALRLPR